MIDYPKDLKNIHEEIMRMDETLIHIETLLDKINEYDKSKKSYLLLKYMLFPCIFGLAFGYPASFLISQFFMY